MQPNKVRAPYPRRVPCARPSAHGRPLPVRVPPRARTNAGGVPRKRRFPVMLPSLVAASAEIHDTPSPTDKQPFLPCCRVLHESAPADRRDIANARPRVAVCPFPPTSRVLSVMSRRSCRPIRLATLTSMTDREALPVMGAGRMTA